MEPLKSLDAYVVTSVNSLLGKSAVFDHAVFAFYNLPLLKGGVIAALLMYAWFAPNARPMGRYMFFARSMIGVVAAVLLSRGLQLLLPFRARPRHDPDVEFRLFEGLHPEGLAGWGSFPSDHAVLYFAVATAVFFAVRTAGIFAYLWAALFACVPRLYFGAHYMSDLAAGAVIGIVVMWAAFRIPLPSVLPSLLGRWEGRYPVSFYALAFLFAFQIVTVFTDSRKIAEMGFEALTGTPL